jgi:hypothetical protein
MGEAEMPYTDINLLPAGKEMTFAQFVLNELAEGKGFLYYSSWGNDGWRVGRDTLDAGEYGWSPKDKSNRDDWTFGISRGFLGLFARVCIIRGPDNLPVVVKGDMAWQLVKAFEALRTERKLKIRAEREAYKAKLRAAEWWP